MLDGVKGGDAVELSPLLALLGGGGGGGRLVFQTYCSDQRALVRGVAV